ncbi:MAG: hypothetical protein EBW68_03070 [Actinobacteria bacterium]|nr:hypothetical protein [Actinomycetota bacterium]
MVWLLAIVIKIFSGATTIMFDFSLEELMLPMLIVNLALNPVFDGETYLTIGLVAVAPVGVPPGKFQILPVGDPSEMS